MDAKGNIVVYSLHGLGFHVFDASNGQETAVVEVGEKVKELRITPFNQIVLLPASRKGLYLFNLYTRSFIKKIPGYETYFGLQRLQLTQDGTKAISYNDLEIPVTNLQTSDIQRTPKRPFLRNRVNCANIFTGDANYVITVCLDKILRIYKYYPEQMQIATRPDCLDEEKISGVYPCLDGRHIVTTTVGPEGQTLSVWDVTSSNVVRRLRFSAIGVYEIRMLNTTTAFANVYIEERKEFSFGFFDLKKGMVSQWMEGKAGHSWAVGFLNETRFLTFSRAHRQLETWDVSTGKLVQKRGFDKIRQADVMLNKNGHTVICSLVQRVEKPNRSLPLIMLDSASDEYYLLKVKGRQLKLQAANLGNEGHLLLCSTLDDTTLIWDLRTISRPLHATLPAVKGLVASAFSKDSSVAVSSQKDGTLVAIGVSTGRIRHRARSQPAHKILISNNKLAITFHRNNFCAWDLNKGENVATFTADWETTSTHVYLIGDHVTMCLPDRAREMTLKLHGIPPGKEEEFLEESPFMGIPVEGNFHY